ncbi:MAG: CBS domain-containing protein [Cyanobacteria bacterium P01_F01_bin.150]
MEFSHALLGSIALKSSIDCHPLLVAPHTPVLEVIAQMSQVKGNVCNLLNTEPNDYQSSSQLDPVPLAQPLTTVGADATVRAAAASFSASVSSRQTSCALIVDKDASINLNQQRVVGIFTERDIVKLVAEGAALDRLTIGEVMVSPVVSLAESEFKDIFAPLFLFRRYQIRHLLITDSCDRPIGIVSPESIRTILRPANLLKLRRVADVMVRDVVCADYQCSILYVAQLMTKHRVSCIVITEQDVERGELPIGIVTERDIVQFRTLELNFSIQAGTVMSSPLCLLKPDDSLWNAHQDMQRLRVRRLVVSWNWGKGLGIVTQTSLLRVFDPLEMYGVLETLQTTIQQLQAEKRLPSEFFASPTVDVNPKLQTASEIASPQSSPPQFLTPQPLTPQPLTPQSSPSQSQVASTMPMLSAESVALERTSLATYLAFFNSAFSCVERLSQHLNLMEENLAEWSENDGDRPAINSLRTDLSQALDAVQILKKLLHSSMSFPSVSATSEASESDC